MSLKPSIGQIVNPYFLQDTEGANPLAVTYPLTVADGVKGGSSAVDPLSLDIVGLPVGTLSTTTEVAINNGAGNEKTTLSDLAVFLDGRDVYSVADITALNAITGMDTGDVAIVADTFDDTGENIAGSYVYNGTTWILQSWYNVYLNTLLDVNAPAPVAGDILQWNGIQWVNVANAFAPINGTPTEVRYFDNAGVDFSDPLFTRDSVTNHTKAVREYESTQQDIQFTGTGNNDLNINAIVTPKNYTFTIDSQDNYTGLLFNGVGLNDIDVNYLSGSIPANNGFIVGIEALSDEISIGSGGFTGTPVSGETFTNGSGAYFSFISYDSGTDTIFAYNVSTSPAPAPTGVFTGSQSGATVTIANVFTISGNEVGLWTDSFSNIGFWSIQVGVPYTIGISYTEDITFPSTGHTLGDAWYFGTVPGSVNINILSQSGPFTPGETITQSGNAGFSATVGADISGTLSIINVVGQLNISSTANTVVGSVSGNTAIPSSFLGSYDTFTWTDGTTTENQVVITAGNQILDSGNITVQFGGDTGHNVSDEWAITQNTVTINTGFRTEPIQFPNVPFLLEASALVSDNGTDKVAIGTFLSPFGGSSMSSGIVGLFGDGSQSTFTMEKGNGNISVFDSVSNRSYNQNFYDSFSANGYDGSNYWSIDVSSSLFRVYYNNIYMNFPNNYGSNGDALLTDGSGNLYRGPSGSTVTPVNGVANLGSDIGLGGSLNQYTNILHNGYSFSLDGIDSANNRSGLIVEPTVLNGIGAFSGAYTGTQSYNKSGVFSTGPNEYGAIMGTSDDTGSIPNASYTRHNYNFNFAIATKHTRLVDVNNDFSRYDDVISVGGGTVSRDISSYIGNPFSTGYGNGYTRTFDLDNGSDTEFLSNNFSNSVVQTSSLLGLGQYQIYVRDASGTNSNALTVTPTDIEILQYPRNRDDTTTTTPINFLYTNSGGKLQSAPLSTIIANKATQVGTDGLGALFTGTVFTLPQIPSFIHGVYVNTAYNHPIVDYTVAGTDITFNTTLSNDLVTVVYEYF